jgi:hypothetical protein
LRREWRFGFGSWRLRGRFGFEARALALFLLLFLVFPTLSRAEPEDTHLELLFPDTVVRGGELELTAVVTGTGNATVRWLLSGGFEPLAGPLEWDCQGSCNGTLVVHVNRSVALGGYDIGLEVSHG